MNIVITGANRGLGYELTAEAVQRGFRVIAAIRASALEGRLLELSGRFPGQIEAAELDVCDEASVERLAAKLKAEGRTVDALINNAAILLSRGVALEELAMDDVIRSFEVNVFGPIRVVKHLLPLMSEAGPRAIVNISSEAGALSNAYGGDYSYALTKSALNMFSKQVKKYVVKRGIRVYALHPGWIRTDMGGEKAPGDPVDSARGIMDIVDATKEIYGDPFFVNIKGEPMPS
ncbi:SDR family oxidoreductase [Paenibacillus thalictri]|uniref:SDR family oxidoreductase n=1 Tax=Paenibacillus thalictri TaxID=2527873 RepID=A0A4Q9DE47_9BACL|nr:SDR family oxidoreductase [Paenibacillus thalictri]TBL69716.1 SDR family oxidoreductase [Paenibacillus thalictri]